MSLRNTTTRYGSVAKFFHWTIAILIICLWIIGYFMGDISDKALRGNAYTVHKITGLIVLLLVFGRLLWRLNNPAPALPAQMATWEKALERAVLFGLYIVMFAMPISGWIFSTAAGYAPHIGALTLPAPGIVKNEDLAHQAFSVHRFIGWAIVVLLFLHLCGVIKHHFINKDNVLRRMLPGAKVE